MYPGRQQCSHRDSVRRPALRPGEEFSHSCFPYGSGLPWPIALWQIHWLPYSSAQVPRRCLAEYTLFLINRIDSKQVIQSVAPDLRKMLVMVIGLHRNRNPVREQWYRVFTEHQAWAGCLVRIPDSGPLVKALVLIHGCYVIWPRVWTSCYGVTHFPGYLQSLSAGFGMLRHQSPLDWRWGHSYRYVPPSRTAYCIVFPHSRISLMQVTGLSCARWIFSGNINACRVENMMNSTCTWQARNMRWPAICDAR